IVNARVIGAATPGVLAIGVRGDRIVALGHVDARSARLVIDAAGLVAAPGFIDVHSHALETLGRSPLRDATALIAQGVTTIVGNPDGGGPVDLERRAAELLADGGVGVNVAQLIGHGSVRGAVMGTADRAPTADELDRMRALIRRARDAGAFG